MPSLARISATRGRGQRGNNKQVRSRHQEVLVQRTVVAASGSQRQKPLSVPPRQIGWLHDRQGTQVLVRPAPNASWRHVDTCWRSVLLKHRPNDQEAQVLSLGLPKFWDPQHDEESVADLEAQAAAGNIPHATVKHDGQLLIRAVYDGQVQWRSRNSMRVDDSLQEGLQQQLQQYPQLQDPQWMADHSLQFEYVSDRHRILVEYPANQLLLIGASDHKTLRPLPWSQVQQAAQSSGVPLPQTVALTGSTLQEWQQQVAIWDKEGTIGEGIVLRDSSGAPRLRLKTRTYQQQWQRRYDHPPAAIVCAWLRGNGQADWSKRLPSLNDDPTYRDECQQQLHTLQQQVTDEISMLQATADEHQSLTTKKFSQTVSSPLGNPQGPALLLLRAGKQQKAQEHLWSFYANRWAAQQDAQTVVAAPSV